MQLKIGDTVRYLNSTGGGRVVRIEGRIAYVDEDGFETPTLMSECVVVASGDSFYKKETPEALARFTAPAEAPKRAPQMTSAPQVATAQPTPANDIAPVEETPEGEKLDVVLGFEPSDIKRLSESTFDAYLVNDSNYYLYATVATRGADAEQWTLRYGGIIEPAMQEFLFELVREDLPHVDRVAVQLMPFKKDKSYTLKQPIAFEQRLDATKFARLHCFDANPYFDNKVLAVDIVKDDEVQGRRPEIDAETMRRAMLEKSRDDRHKARPVKVSKPAAKSVNNTLEVDLHASELLDSTAGLSKADILNYQIDTFRRIMDENLRNAGRTIIFIHGKGEGVLRAALMKELTHRYKGHDVSDASFREYGFGATKVVIRNTK